MKSFLTKLGGLLLCGVMFTAVGCHDYAEDIKDVNDRLDKIDGVLSGDSEGVAKDLAALKATVAVIDANYATEAELEKSVGDLQTVLEGKISAAVKEANDAVAALQADVANKADRSELTAKIGELNAAMEDAKTKMETALAGLDAKYVALEVYQDAISKINSTLEGIDDIYLTKEAFNDAKATLQTAMTTLQDKVTAVEGSIETLKEALESKVEMDEVKAEIELAVKVVADKVAALKTTVGTIETSLSDVQKDIEANKTAIEEVKESLTTEVSELEAAIALKADKTAVEAINSDLSALASIVNELAATVELKANQADLETAKTELEAAIDAKADASVVEALKGRVETIEGNIETLTDALADAKEELEAAIALKADKTALEEVQSTLQAAIDSKVSQEDYDAKVEELTSAIAEKVAKVDFDTAISGLQKSIDALAEENKEAHESLLNYTAEVKKEMREMVASFNEEIKKLHEQIDALQAEFKKLSETSSVSADEIAQLFARIQSVVFKPEYADGDARVAYASIGVNNDVVLEGYSEITYKVYPVNCAKTIADAINAKENPVLTASFDAIKVKSEKIDASLDVISAKADEDGCLTITFDANLGEDFYKGTQSYAAALVLAETRDDNPQIFSTEYTTFVKADPVIWEMALYVGDTPYAEYIKVAENEAYTNVTWPFVAVGKEYQKEILPGVTPKFVATIDNETVVKTPEEFAALGYDAAYTVATTVEYPDHSLPEQVISVGTYEDEAMASLVPTLVNKANVDDPNANATVKKTFVWTVSGEDAVAEANLDVVDFDYILKVNSPAHEKVYGIEYTAVNETVAVLGGEDAVELVFVNKNDKTDVVPAEDMVADYPVIEIKSKYRYYHDWESFTITPASEDYAYPVSVKLASDVSFKNVSDEVRINYWFYAPVLGDDGSGTSDTNASVKINPETHEFTLTADTRNWNYREDATVDAAIMNKAQDGNKYIYTNEVAVAEGAETDDIKLSELLATAKYYFGEVKEGAEIEGVKFSKAADAENVKVEFTGFAWDKKYNMIAHSELPSGQKKTVTNEDGSTTEISIPAAIIYVYFDLTTVDRNREPVTYTAEKAVEIPFAKNLNIVTEDSYPLDGLYTNLVEAGNLNADAEAQADYLKNLSIVNNTIKFVEVGTEVAFLNGSFLHSHIVTDAELLADNSYKVAYNALANIRKGNELFKDLVDILVAKTWYGQEIRIEQSVKLLDPKYDFAPVPQYSKEDEKGYYIDVLAEYGYDADNIMNSFSTKGVELNGAFDVVDENGTVINDKMDELGLHREYKMIGNTDSGITFADAPANSVIAYNGTTDAVNVNGVLYIKNDNGTVYPITETIFSGAFKSFEVRKYDPIVSMTILPGKAEQEIPILEAKEYNFAVLDNYSLVDRLGNELINSENVADAKNDFLYNYAKPEVYDLEPSYTMQAFIGDKEVSVLPTGITFENGIITVDNTALIQFANPVIVKVTATVAYPQGEQVGQTVTYTFK